MLRGTLLRITSVLVAAACGPRRAPAVDWKPGETPIQLVPQPVELHRAAGWFVASDVEIGAAAEDMAAAETVAEEIRGAGGLARIGPHGTIQLERVDDATLPDEGYTIDVTPGRIRVAARTAAGVYYGTQTLRQLVRPRPTGGAFAVPAVSIRDWPAMRWRGAMDDVSRGPVPTVAYVKEQIRTLAAFKVNLYSLYFETVFDSAAHPLLARPDGAFTADELRDIVAFAARHHVTLLPQQQTFGHLHGMLLFEKYRDVAERPHGHVLAPGDAASALVDQLVDELLPIFPGPLFHVGADETFELGAGKSAARAAAEGLGAVYLAHLARLAARLEKDGKEMLFWGDVARRYPELLGALPKNAIAVAWSYDPQGSFEHEIAPFRRAGMRVMVAPGTSSWSSVVPNYPASFINVRNFVRDGHAAGALGALVTTWDDDGDSLFDLTWPALALAAACAWQGGAPSIADFEDRYDWVFYRNDDHTFRDVLRDLGRAHTLLATVKRGPSNDVMWLDPFSPEGAAFLADTLPLLGEVRLAAERAVEALRRSPARARTNRRTLAALELAARRVDALGLKFQLADEVMRSYGEAHAAAAAGEQDRERVWGPMREVSDIDGRLQDLRDVYLELKELHAAAWRLENRPGYLGSVLVRYDRFTLDVQAKIDAVARARMRYRTDRTLPSPAEIGLARPAAVAP